jgi:hypothetical protein
MVQLDKEPAIIVRKPDATLEPAPQDIQLMSEHRVLSFKPQLRLEWEGKDGQNETEPPDHSPNLGDSIAPSTALGFWYTQPPPCLPQLLHIDNFCLAQASHSRQDRSARIRIQNGSPT